MMSPDLPREIVWLYGYCTLKRVGELCRGGKVEPSILEEKRASLGGEIPPEVLTPLKSVVPNVAHRHRCFGERQPARRALSAAARIGNRARMVVLPTAFGCAGQLALRASWWRRRFLRRVRRPFAPRRSAARSFAIRPKH